MRRAGGRSGRGGGGLPGRWAVRRGRVARAAVIMLMLPVLAVHGLARRAPGWALARRLRRWLPDGNPLRRGSDRAESVVLAGLLAAFLVGAPVAAVAAGAWAAAGGRLAQRASASLRQVPAMLVRNAPGPAQARSSASQEPLVPARWIAPDGTRRRGDVYAPPGARAGSTVMIWTDRAGQVTGAPLPAAAVTARVAEAAAAATVAVALVVTAAAVVARTVIDRRRLAAWDVHWSVTEPQWTGRR